MKVIIEVEGKRRLVNSNFKLYGTNEDLIVIGEAIAQALAGGLIQGWVNVGGQVKDETLFAFDVTKDEKPTYPFAPKIP